MFLFLSPKRLLVNSLLSKVTLFASRWPFLFCNSGKLRLSSLGFGLKSFPLYEKAALIIIPSHCYATKRTGKLDLFILTANRWHPTQACEASPQAEEELTAYSM